MMLQLFIIASLTCSTLAWGPEYRGALYTLSQTDRQEVLVSALFQNGTIEYVAAVPTGGKGTGARGVDPLQAADGLIVNDHYLFAVNPASDEITIFEFDPQEPWALKKVGDNIWSGGLYPTSLAVSPNGTKLAVANSGGNGTLRVITLSRTETKLDEDFAFDLGLGQTLPPVGPPKTPSDLYFTPNGQQLYLSVKGAANASLLPAGRIEVFCLNASKIAHQSTVVPPTGPGGLPFSITPVPASGAILVTDPAVGIDVVQIDDSGASIYNRSLAYVDQAASCWSAYSEVIDRYITADLIKGRLTWVSINATTLSAVVEGCLNLTGRGNQPGKPVDLRVAHFSDSQDYLYSLDAAEQLLRVFSLPQGATGLGDAIQEFSLADAYAAGGGELTASIEGLAIALRPEVIS